MNRFLSKDNTFFIISIILLVILTWGYGKYKALENELVLIKFDTNPTEKESFYKKGDMFPFIEGISIHNTTKKYPLTSGDRRKLLVFSSETCPYCQEFYPTLDSIDLLQNIDVIVLQGNSTPKSIKKLVKEKKYHFDIVSISDSIFNKYKIYSTPTSFLLNKDLTLRKQFNYSFTYKYLSEYLK